MPTTHTTHQYHPPRRWRRRRPTRSPPPHSLTNPLSASPPAAEVDRPWLHSRVPTGAPAPRHLRVAGGDLVGSKAAAARLFPSTCAALRGGANHGASITLDRVIHLRETMVLDAAPPGRFPQQACTELTEPPTPSPRAALHCCCPLLERGRLPGARRPCADRRCPCGGAIDDGPRRSEGPGQVGEQPPVSSASPPCLASLPQRHTCGLACLCASSSAASPSLNSHWPTLLAVLLRASAQPGDRLL